jgi:hypothetical protein
MSESLIEVYRTHQAGQEKYVYFLLAGAGAAIAFAISQTRELPLAWTQLPLAAAVSCWGISFYAGCKYVKYRLSDTFANFELLRLQSGQHPEASSHPSSVAAAEGIANAMRRNSSASSRWSKTQFLCLAIGAVLYVTWHTIEMYQRTLP